MRTGKICTILTSTLTVLALTNIFPSEIALVDVAAAQSCTVNANTGVTVDTGVAQSKIQGANWQSQTFTVTGEGCFLLNQVTVSVKKSGSPSDLVLEIHNASSDAPTSTSLASTTVLASAVGTSFGDVTATFSTPPQIMGGSQYALVVHQVANGGTGTNFYELGRDDNNPYSGGPWCKSLDSGTTWDCPNGPGGGIDARMSICVSACPTCAAVEEGDACTKSQGFYGSSPGAGSFLGGLSYPFSVGMGFSITFTSAAAIQNYLPAGGTPGQLTMNEMDPVTTDAGDFGGQVTTLKLNLLWDAQFGSGDFGDLKINDPTSAFNGETVSQFLAAAESVLGGGALLPGTTIGGTGNNSYNDVATKLNESFDTDTCTPSDWAVAFLVNCN